jgi:glucose-6-phosphate 1-dehydrogenase
MIPRAPKLLDSCAIVIFGVTGDLTARKLMPALFNLHIQGLLPPKFRCIGVARKEKTDGQFQDEIKEALETFSREKPSIHSEKWESFAPLILYHQSQFDDSSGYLELKKKLKMLEKSEGISNWLHYLSTPPSYFPSIVQHLNEQNLIHPVSTSGPWSRVIIEKPFGHDLDSCLELQKQLGGLMHESQIYRIDHYLGKDTVQNLLVLRFSNLLFESIWNHHYIDHIQITAAEDLGIGRRGAFFEEAGILRDIIQNHVMQLLSLIAMEPPVSLGARDIRSEKVKVLQAIRPIDLHQLEQLAVRGQYTKGQIGFQDVAGYREEKDVDPNSRVETFAAVKLHIDNWRWAGVPFYLRAGKRLSKRCTEVAIVFKNVPSVLFQASSDTLQNNALIIRIQPNDGISLNINCKMPNLGFAIRPVSLDFDFDSLNHTPTEAYERLLCDCMLGDNTLFARDDEVLQSWKILTPLLKAWEKPLEPHEFYVAGSQGPVHAKHLFPQDSRGWHEL